MIKNPDVIERPEAFQRFRDSVKAVLALPHAEIKKRIEAHREQAAKNPNCRGPKRKTQ